MLTNNYPSDFELHEQEKLQARLASAAFRYATQMFTELFSSQAMQSSAYSDLMELFEKCEVLIGILIKEQFNRARRKSPAHNGPRY